MKRNWLLIKEILQYLVEYENSKSRYLGCMISTGKYVLVKDKFLLLYEEKLKNGFDSCKDIAEIKEKSKSNAWDIENIDFHVDLLCEIKAIKIIKEDISENISDEILGESYNYYEDAEILRDRLGQAYQATFEDVEFFQITWVGIEIFNLLNEMYEKGIDLENISKTPLSIFNVVNSTFRKNETTH